MHHLSLGDYACLAHLSAGTAQYLRPDVTEEASGLPGEQETGPPASLPLGCGRLPGTVMGAPERRQGSPAGHLFPGLVGLGFQRRRAGKAHQALSSCRGTEKANVRIKSSA